MRPVIHVAVLLGALALEGCFAIADLDRFETENPCAGNVNSIRDFSGTLRGFDSAEYIGKRLDIALHDRSLVVSARAVIHTIDEDGEAYVFMRDALAPGVDMASLLVDVDGDLKPSDGDDGFRPTLCASGEFDFTEDGRVVDVRDPPLVDAGGEFRMNLTDLLAHERGTQLFDLQIIDKESGRVVGYYHVPSVVDATGGDQKFDLTIPGVIAEGRTYVVEYYADNNQNGEYDHPPADHAWRDEVVGESGGGVTLNFVHNVNFAMLTF